MSLLSKNNSLKNQSFAELLDIQSQVSYEDITKDSIICDSSLLPHIALIKGANIDEMQENEARAYLKTFNRKYIGTVGAVEDALKVYFDSPKVVEWFEDKSLLCGDFSIDLKIEDGCRKFNKTTLEKTEKLIKRTKNVRSHLKEIKLNYLSENNSSINIGFVCENSQNLEMHNAYEENIEMTQITNIGLASESFYYIKMEGLR